MDTITFKVNEQQKEKFKAFYQEWQIASTNPYIEFVAKYEKITISVYTSNKIVLQGLKAKKEIEIWLSQGFIVENSSKSTTSKSTKVESKINPSKRWKFEEDHIGSDEVGTGDYFGPVCVVACYIRKTDLPLIESLQVGDSKTINDENIMKIAPELLKNITYASVSFNNEKYNTFHDKGYNMNKIKACLHNQAILKLRQKLNKEIPGVVDQFCEEGLYYRYLMGSPQVARNLTFITKGESHSPAVAAASVLARYSFLLKLKELGDTYQVVLPKGAGNEVDQFAKSFYLNHGKDAYTKVVKLHFKNTDKVLTLLNKIAL